MELALNDWTHPRTGVVREYIQNLREVIDFKPEWNRRGRIVGGTLRGQEINGKWAREIDAITAYIEDGEIVIIGADDTDRPMVMEAIEDAMHEETKPEQDREIDGAVFAGRRTALGLSQSDVARAFGVPQAKVSRWESGKSPIPSGVHTGMMRLEEIVDREYRSMSVDLGRGKTVHLGVWLGGRFDECGIDIEPIKQALMRVIVGRAYADAWLDEGVRTSRMRFERGLTEVQQVPGRPRTEDLVWAHLP